jgi:hypothetical protein
MYTDTHLWKFIYTDRCYHENIRRYFPLSYTFLILNAVLYFSLIFSFINQAQPMSWDIIVVQRYGHFSGYTLWYILQFLGTALTFQTIVNYIM